MRTKSAYRTKHADNIPAETLDIPERVQPSETTHIEFTNNKADPSVGIVSADEIPEPDEATLALQKQIAGLKKSEELQKQYALHMQAQRAAQMAAPEPALPDSPSDRIALWKQGGLSDEDATYLQARPAMVQYPMITKAAYAATLQAGIERDSPDFAAAMEGNFASLLNRAQARPAPAATPEFFRPPPAPSPARAEPSAMYSAPVSRQAPSGSLREPSPRQLKLSPEERQIAAASGISDVQYAQNKLRMLRERAAGERE
jgi:hypothetical protein